MPLWLGFVVPISLPCYSLFGSRKANTVIAKKPDLQFAHRCRILNWRLPNVGWSELPFANLDPTMIE